jgi:hypothetical protein
MANRNGSSANRAETIRVAVLNREIPTGLGGYVVSPYFIDCVFRLFYGLTQGFNAVKFALVTGQFRIFLDNNLLSQIKYPQ